MKLRSSIDLTVYRYTCKINPIWWNIGFTQKKTLWHFDLILSSISRARLLLVTFTDKLQLHTYYQQNNNSFDCSSVLHTILQPQISENDKSFGEYRMEEMNK